MKKSVIIVRLAWLFAQNTVSNQHFWNIMLGKTSMKSNLNLRSFLMRKRSRVAVQCLTHSIRWVIFGMSYVYPIGNRVYDNADYHYNSGEAISLDRALKIIV
ncbi:MAG: hypothetical protein QG670_2284 [Thermoproteota archaeon]|nr:hypothetical protein [Thermoproteota archaeon]